MTPDPLDGRGGRVVAFVVGAAVYGYLAWLAVVVSL